MLLHCVLARRLLLLGQLVGPLQFEADVAEVLLPNRLGQSVHDPGVQQGV